LPAVAAEMARIESDQDTEALRKVLFPPLNLLLGACLAEASSRHRLGQAIIQWALSVAPTFFPLPEATALRRELVADLRPLLPFFPSPQSSAFADPDAQVAALCEHCFPMRQQEKETTDHARLAGASNWILVRSHKHGLALMCPDARGLSSIRLQILDVGHGRLTRASVLPCTPSTAWRSAAGWVGVPAAGFSQQLEGPRGPGKCFHCRRLTQQLLMLGICPLV